MKTRETTRSVYCYPFKYEKRLHFTQIYETLMMASTASGISHTVTAICRYRGRVGNGLSVLWVAYATHSTLKPVPTLPR
jgi:hypothetical protein